MEIAKRMKQIAPSMTLAIDAKAKKLKEEGVDVLNFGAGEPDFNTPQPICDAAKKAIDEGHHKYTPVAGHPGTAQGHRPISGEGIQGQIRARGDRGLLRGQAFPL